MANLCGGMAKRSDHSTDDAATDDVSVVTDISIAERPQGASSRVIPEAMLLEALVLTEKAPLTHRQLGHRQATDTDAPAVEHLQADGLAELTQIARLWRL